MDKKLIIDLLKQLLWDSKKLSEEAEEKLIRGCSERFSEIYQVYKKYDFPKTFYTDYFPGPGVFSIPEEENEDAIEKERIAVLYENPWNSSKFFMHIEFNQFEDSYLGVLERSLKNLKIASLENKIKGLEKSLEEQKNLLYELRKSNIWVGRYER